MQQTRSDLQPRERLSWLHSARDFSASIFRFIGFAGHIGVGLPVRLTCRFIGHLAYRHVSSENAIFEIQVDVANEG